MFGYECYYFHCFCVVSFQLGNRFLNTPYDSQISQFRRFFFVQILRRIKTYLIEADFGAVSEYSATHRLLEDVSQGQVADMRVIGSHVQWTNPLLQTRGTGAEEEEERKQRSDGNEKRRDQKGRQM